MDIETSNSSTCTGKQREVKVYKVTCRPFFSYLWKREDPFGPISTQTGKVVEVDDTVRYINWRLLLLLLLLIIQSNFSFNIFRGFRSKGDQNFHFTIDLAGHHYTSAAATRPPVVCKLVICNQSRSYINVLIQRHFLVSEVSHTANNMLWWSIRHSHTNASGISVLSRPVNKSLQRACCTSQNHNAIQYNANHYHSKLYWQFLHLTIQQCRKIKHERNKLHKSRAAARKAV